MNSQDDLPTAVAGQTGMSSGGCQQCGPDTQQPPAGGAWSGLVYAVGQLTPQFPSLGVEKEFAQLIDVEPAAGDETTLLRRTLEQPAGGYLGRHICWMFSVHHVDTFTVVPRDDADVARLVQTISPDEGVHVVVGRTAPAGFDAPCRVPGLPAVVADQLLAFIPDEFAEGVPPPDDDNQSFPNVVRQVFTQLTRRADSSGLTDESRALNYVALRYPAVYHAAFNANGSGMRLVKIDARHRHSPMRRTVSIRLKFRHRRSDITESFHCVVDVTEVFPFLVAPLQPTFD